MNAFPGRVGRVASGRDRSRALAFGFGLSAMACRGICNRIFGQGSGWLDDAKTWTLTEQVGSGRPAAGGLAVDVVICGWTAWQVWVVRVCMYVRR